MEMSDTLMYFKKLEEAGFTRQQAEAQVRIVDDYFKDNIATKTDLMRLEVKINGEFQTVRTALRDLTHKVDTLESRLTIRLGGMMIVGFGALAAFIKLV
jgi:hypothetical protein